MKLKTKSLADIRQFIETTPIHWVRYPRLVLLLLTFILAYFLYYSGRFDEIHHFFTNLGYLTPFFAGMLFVYGFTAVPAAALLAVVSSDYNLWGATLAGGIGALIGDLLIFYFVRSTLENEIREISHEKIFIYFKMIFNFLIPEFLKKFIFPIFIGFILSSPFPDELAIVLLTSTRKISPHLFALLAFTLNTAGIFLILWAAR